MVVTRCKATANSESATVWTTRLTNCPGGVRVELNRGSDPAGYADVIDGWCGDVGFGSWFNSVLAKPVSLDVLLAAVRAAESTPAPPREA